MKSLTDIIDGLTLLLFADGVFRNLIHIIFMTILP